MINAIIVDDEPRSCQVLSKILTSYCPDVKVKTAVNTVDEGIDAIAKYQPDLVFLDIEMPNGGGFSLLKRFSTPTFSTIMVTAYNQYAIEAIKESVFDYVLKPIGIDQLKEAIERYKKRVKKKEKNGTDTLSKLPLKVLPKLTIYTQNGYELIDASKIIWAQASSSYTLFHLTEGKTIVSSYHLKKFEDQLETMGGFLRIHHSYYVNIEHIQRVVKNKSTTVVMSDGKALEVSVRKKDELNKLIHPI
jgi:two-component system, LytTR family, response regulator